MTKQLELIERKPRRSPNPVPDEVVYRQPSMLAALRLAIQAAGVDEKEVYLPLRIDKATWSKIMSGQFNFPTNKYHDFMDLVGNEIPLIWLAGSRGYKLQPLLSEHERQITQLQSENAELRKEIETLAKYGVIQRAKS